MRVLTWNLKHGRAVPSAGHELFEEFAAALDGWRWDAALLQEVPPWWPARFAGRLRAEARLALTSRNALLPLRRAIAVRWPDVVKSNGGGANAILVRDGPIATHCVRRVCWLPERRWLHAVRVGELWLANVHLAARVEQARLAARVAREWAGADALVLGGDFNVRALELDGFSRLAVRDVDYVFAGAGLAGADAAALDAGHLSDHPPLAVTVLMPSG